MDGTFLKDLDAARTLAGVPFKVNSAYRSIDYEFQHGRTGTSSHCKGLAVDIACNNSAQRLKMVKALLLCGFCRIGIYKNFIHVDKDPDKVACIWLNA